MNAAIDVARLTAGHRRTLAQAITLIESTRREDQLRAQALIEAVLPQTGQSLRIGISGAPGAGKSTFIEAFGLHAVAAGHRVAVLAVDPSSPLSGGSILGDKTRMERLVRNPAAFVRPSPSGGALGGVAQKTREAMLLCEAAGFDVILVETVGVGQSEYDVAQMVDFFLVLLLPNAGDELQGIKRGILELAHAVVVNKADGGNEAAAERTRQQHAAALSLFRADSWKPPALCCSARDERGVDAVWDTVLSFRSALGADTLARRRADQGCAWMWRLVAEQQEARLRADPRVRGLIVPLEAAVRAGSHTPYAAACALLAAADGREPGQGALLADDAALAQTDMGTTGIRTGVDT